MCLTSVHAIVKIYQIEPFWFQYNYDLKLNEVIYKTFEYWNS